jgi:hypothetical protein
MSAVQLNAVMVCRRGVRCACSVAVAATGCYPDAAHCAREAPCCCAQAAKQQLLELLHHAIRGVLRPAH